MPYLKAQVNYGNNTGTNSGTRSFFGESAGASNALGGNNNSFFGSFS